MDSTEIDEAAEITNGVNNLHGTSYGSPSLDIDISYVRAVLALFIAGSIRLRAKKVVYASIAEDHVTYFLDEEMRAVQRANRSDIIHWIIQPNIKRDRTDPLLRCEPDFVFFWADEETDPDLCLYAEAKRLFGIGASLAGKYVDEGVLDFIEARYG